MMNHNELQAERDYLARVAASHAAPSEHNIVLGDDGTMDTVLYCAACQREYRYTFDGSDGEDYGNFLAWAVNDATDQHTEDDAS